VRPGLTDVRLQPNRLAVGLDEPGLAVSVVVEQAGVLGFAHVPGPDHAGVIDVRPVVDPLHLLAGIILRPVANDDQMLARHSLEVCQEMSTFEPALARR
jgi:hypothetical protein